MWELDCEEGWAPKNWCFWTVVLEKTLQSPLDCKEIQPVLSEEDQPWVFFGRNDAKAETPVLWPPHVKSWLIGKDSDAGRDWEQEEKGSTEDEMAGWHHWLDGHASEWTLGVGDGQGGVACGSSWGHKELDTTEWLNWTEADMDTWFLPRSSFLSPSFVLTGIDPPLLVSPVSQAVSHLANSKPWIVNRCYAEWYNIQRMGKPYPCGSLVQWEMWSKQETARQTKR